MLFIVDDDNTCISLSYLNTFLKNMQPGIIFCYYVHLKRLA